MGRRKRETDLGEVRADLDHLTDLQRENPDKAERVARWLAGADEQVVERDGLPDLIFVGRLLAEAKSPSRLRSSIVVLRLFETSGGQYVCQHATHHNLDGSRYTAECLPDEAELVRHLADRHGVLGHLEKDLLQKAGLGHLPAVSERLH